jgi:sugar phosphate isomerase/epimerase
LRWGFSTLGCPEFSLEEACKLAAEFQLDALELRSLWGRVDLPQCAAELGISPDQARALLSRFHLRVPVAGSSFKLVGNDVASRADFLDYCRWAESWHIPNVRVFGGGTWGQPLGESDYGHAVETVTWWRREKKDRGWKLEMWLETHDAFSASAPCCELMRRLAEPLGIIWDSHHTWRLGEEKSSASWARLGQWIRHVHIKDSIDKPSARHPYTYVLPGEGQAPLAEIIGTLRDHHFSGIVSLEWERLWHPYLLPLRSALNHLRLQPWFDPARVTLDQTDHYSPVSVESKRRSLP